MKSPQRIAIIANTTEEWGSVLKGVAARYPEASLTVILPPATQVLPAEKALCQEILELRLSSRPGDVLALVRYLRREGFDLLVFRFESLRLRGVAAFARAKAAACWTDDGQVWPLATRLTPSLWQLMQNRVRGYSLLLRVMLSVLLHRVRPR